MAAHPDIEELRATRERMEGKYLTEPQVRALYEGLCRRFLDDLSDERDVLLSECAVLMAIKEGVRRA
ncbi:MAG: hypothetical protein HY371_14760 [Devosia nanyangense]|jgi:hypothetical protein|nr:hypothetical protein [Devosia nanyangense]